MTSKMCSVCNTLIISLLALLCIAKIVHGGPNPFGNRITGDKWKINIDEQGDNIGGDMIIPDKMFIEVKSGISGSHYRWSKGKMPYTMDETFTPSEKKVILEALNEIQNKTCIRFAHRTTEEDFVHIIRGGPNSGCWSSVGKQGGKQELNLQAGNPGCIFKGIIAHELIHAIGYFHEQSRTDRDSYVRVHWENIKQGFEHNFDKYDFNKINSHDVSYDFESIMHYSAQAFSKNGEITLEPIQPGVPRSAIGQRKELSPKDALKINNMYKNIC